MGLWRVLPTVHGTLVQTRQCPPISNMRMGGPARPGPSPFCARHSSGAETPVPCTVPAHSMHCAAAPWLWVVVWVALRMRSPLPMTGHSAGYWDLHPADCHLAPLTCLQSSGMLFSLLSMPHIDRVSGCCAAPRAPRSQRPIVSTPPAGLFAPQQMRLAGIGVHGA